jgi:outer membrane usher protein
VERLLLVDINRQQMDQPALVLESKTGEIYLWSKDLQRWRLRNPDEATGILHQGEIYFPLSAISHVSHAYDPKELTLMIELRADAFVSSRLTTRYDTLPPPVKPGPGGFINYDVLMSRSPESVQSSGLFELGVFNRFGVGVSTLLMDDHDPHANVTRLDTTWTVDFPEKLRSLRLGDAINVAGSWGRSVQFGGIQYGTNFGTQPGFITLPVQSAVGQAVLPSTVDVFINNALVSQQTVPPGPFSISNLPVVSGAGEVQLVVRDLLGRQQIITRPFYASQSLLRKGLKSYSMELGLVRENFGIHSNDYGDWLASGTLRRGISDSFTGEVHAEAMPGQATAGAGGDYLVPQLGLLSGYLVASHGPTGNGGLLMLGMERQAQPWSVGARTQWTSSEFAQVGQTQSPPQRAPVLSSSVNLSYTAGRMGSISFAYVEQRNRDQDDTRIATMSYSVAVGNWGNATVAALRDLQGRVGTTIFALLSVPLDPGVNASLSSQQVRGDGTGNSGDFSATLQKNLPIGEGFGYRLRAGGEGAGEAVLYLQNDVGTYALEASRFQGATATRLGVSGGFAFLGGDMFPSRRIEQSFAVARIADYPNVRVLTDNQPAGRTDARGNALLPRLRAYDVNVIALDQRDLPMDAKIGAVRVNAVPYFRSGIDVIFPVTHAHGATLTIALDDGSAMPVGAMVTLDSNDELFTVGFDGEVYLAGLRQTNTLQAKWSGHQCIFDFKYAPTSDPLPDLGTYYCKEINP